MTRSVRRGIAGALALGALVFAGVGLGAATYTDDAGDDNAAPDVVSVTVSNASESAFTVRVELANQETLPADRWINVWLDLDGDEDTGVLGNDALVRYLGTGAVELLLSRGSDLTLAPPTGITGTYEAGVLTVTVPRTTVGAAAALGVLVVTSRRQLLGAAQYTSSDFAPDTGRYRWSGTEPQTFSDPVDDHEAAPDITSVRVSDAKDGWIRFDITTPNYEILRGQSLVILSIDVDNRSATGSAGSDVLIPAVGGEVQLQRWNSSTREFDDTFGGTRVRSRNAANVLTIEVHGSELGNPHRFRFRLASAVFDSATGAAFAVDLAPNGGGFWGYRLTNRPVLRLLAGRAAGSPTVPVAGKPFLVSMPIRRSDTNRAVASGAVTCNVRVAGRRVPSRGRILNGSAQCSFVVPRGGGIVAGSMTVRAGGATVTSRFSFRAR